MKRIPKTKRKIDGFLSYFVVALIVLFLFVFYKQKTKRHNAWIELTSSPSTIATTKTRRDWGVLFGLLWFATQRKEKRREKQNTQTDIEKGEKVSEWKGASEQKKEYDCPPEIYGDRSKKKNLLSFVYIQPTQHLCLRCFSQNNDKNKNVKALI